MKKIPVQPYGKRGEGLRRHLPSQFRTNQKEYEWIARKLYELPSKNDFLLQRILPRNLNQELEKMRKLHRSRGISDDTFLHPKLRREKNLPWKTGRRKVRLENGGKRGAS